MRIRIFLVAAFALLLAACNSQSVEPTLTPSPAPTAPATPTPLPQSSCSAITMEPTPSFSADTFPITADDLILGSSTAPVTVINYCDLQSVDCYGLGTIFEKLLENHPNDLRVVIRPIPLLEMDGFENSMIASQAMIAARKQGKQRELYDLLFNKYGEWASLSTSAFEAWLARETPEIGLDRTRFAADLNSEETEAAATESYNAAKAIGVQPPYPLVLLNGIPVNVGLLYYEYLDPSISLIALGSRQFTECPPFLVDPSKQYIATLRTEKGDIVLQLFADKAPLAVNSFVFLAKEGWFDNVTFHRVIPGFVAQAGDPSGTGQGGPGYFFKNESSDLRFDRPGMVGMANSGTDTNGSQFFITYSPQPQLDGGYTIFGQVMQGMDVVESLTSRDPQQGLNLPPGDKILSVEIVEK
jgi:cyclophilin family peptidyl-prolyl cis-trans isomerase/protein-disulfide isomerase